MINKTMTIADLLAAIDAKAWPTTEELPADAHAALREILGTAAAYYDDCDGPDRPGYDCACWRVLDLGAYLVEAEGINEEVANDIAGELSAIASFALEADGLSSVVRARLEAIKNASELFASPAAAE